MGAASAAADAHDAAADAHAAADANVAAADDATADDAHANDSAVCATGEGASKWPPLPDTPAKAF